jgi:hypothetical protein
MARCGPGSVWTWCHVRPCIRSGCRRRRIAGRWGITPPDRLTAHAQQLVFRARVANRELSPERAFINICLTRADASVIF